MMSWSLLIRKSIIISTPTGSGVESRIGERQGINEMKYQQARQPLFNSKTRETSRREGNSVNSNVPSCQKGRI